jgi:hypothetical protein
MVFRLKIALFAFISGFIFSCTSPLYKPTSKNTEDVSALEELKTGRKTYIKKCSNCHALILPEKYSADQWKPLVEKMEKRAKLTKEDSYFIINYLTKNKVND